MRTLIPLLLFFWSASFVCWGTTYYAATNGSSANTGLSTNSPWPLDYALASMGASNTVMLMDGLYAQHPANWGWFITQPYQTIKAINKWGPKFYNLPITNGGGVFEVLISGNGDGATIDGLAFSNCQYEAVSIRKVGARNCTIRNCWIRNIGQTWTASSAASGIMVYPGLNVLIENNLIEYCGTNGVLTHNHGIYGGGTNGVYRNNVCRYNCGYGINIDSHGNPSTDVGNRIYNNLMYGNYGGGTLNAPGDQLAVYDDSVSSPSSGSQTNFVYGNTIISLGAYGVICQNGTILFTNNIIISTNDGVHKWSAFSGDTITGDYNLAPQALGYPGSHDTVTNSTGFVNTNAGLYWLKSDSPARGKALAGAGGPVNFFGNAQSSVTDIGAFQYKATYASDSRVLDPSPKNPDYWQSLAGTNGGSAAITVTPASRGFGSVPVGSTKDQTFTVQNIGSGTLSGSAGVSAPFSILSGGSYSLGAGLSQVVTVRYSPSTAGSDTATIAFTGGNGATASVFGTATYPPLPPPNLRFTALH